ncbi:MAG TPA: FG-GAP-like repeat-containing protein, partial [Pirellulales bacterium]|nr:FG-GAP-like repeat-containing protein [Pirellulales bacterium]
MSASNTPSSPPRRRWRFAVLAAVCVCGLVAVAWFSLRNDVSPDEFERLETLKNFGLAHLENSDMKDKTGTGQGDLSVADATFVEIAERLPNEPLGPRNLTIARLQALDKELIGAAPAIAAAERLLKVEPQSAAAHVVAARVAKAAGDEPAALSRLTRATQLAPDDPAAWFDIYQLRTTTRDDAIHQHAIDALVQVQRIAPTNLFALAKLVGDQADAEDPRIAETLKALRETLATMPGLVDTIRKETRDAIPDVVEYVGETATAAEGGVWPTVKQHARQLQNVVLAQSWTKSDQRRVDKNDLEFVLHDFVTLRARRYGAGAGDERPIAVKFEELPAPQSLPAGLLGIEDLELADFDLDGELDVFVLRESVVEVYGRAAEPEGWKKIAECAVPPGFTRMLVADFDQDNAFQPGTRHYRDRLAAGKSGDPCRAAGVDVVVYGPPGIALLCNEFDWSRATHTLSTVGKAPPWAAVEYVLAVAAADIYHDGDLDLIVSTAKGLAIWSNRGDMTFVDVSGRSQMPPTDLQVTAIIPVDWDRDVDLDLLIAGPTGKPAGYLENLRHAQFRWRPFESGFDALKNAGAMALLDSDGNGSWDLAAATKAGPVLVQTEISRAGLVMQRASTSLGASARSGIAAWDYDNDGRQDLLTWSESGIDCYRGSKRGDFALVPQLPGKAFKPIRACKVGDLDGDGDLDLAVAEADRVVLLSNEGGNANHWLKLRLWADAVDAQTIEFKSNFYGLGGVIEIRSGTDFQRQPVLGQITHFGLGKHNEPDAARVIWPNGIPQSIIRPWRDSVICDKQMLGGSCPYLYTWTGDRFEFCTDCLWSAPIGLQLADGVLAPSRSWEYLRIDGDRLKPRDGVYRLQITEELWEAAYFDQ